MLKISQKKEEFNHEENRLKNVLSALSDTEIKRLPLSSSLSELKPEQMKVILQRLFGDSIHVIDPDLSLQASPLARAPAQAVGSVQYLRALRPLTPLKKPVVMLVSQPQSWTSFSSGGSFPGTRVTHGWHAIVIVPQNYQTPEGKSVGNDQNPRLYYFDPQKQARAESSPGRNRGILPSAVPRLSGTGDASGSSCATEGRTGLSAAKIFPWLPGYLCENSKQ